MRMRCFRLNFRWATSSEESLTRGTRGGARRWGKAALHRLGQATSKAPFEIPDNWEFGHGDYLQLDPPSPSIVVPTDVPPDGSSKPGANYWQAAWTAAFVSTRFR